MEDSTNLAKRASMNGADLGSLARTVDNENTVVCPFPRSWYPAGSPCARTDDTVTGTEQRPWVAPDDKARLSTLWEDFTSIGPTLKTLGYVALGLTAVWLTIRGLEAYATISKE